MKKLISAAAALVWAGAAFAGDWHQADTLKCSECHTMHASRTHALGGANPATDDVGWTGNPAAPNDHLLIQNGVNQTCLACHDNTAVPDVFARNEQGPAQNKRSAGALNGTVLGAHDNTGYDTYMGHTMGSVDVPPGYERADWDPATEGFHCGNCHAIHGSDVFRNAGAGAEIPGLPGVFKKVGTANQKAAGLFNNQGARYNAKVANTPRPLVENADYDVFVDNVNRTYVTADVEFRIGQGRMNQYCGVCHGQFHNDTAADTTNTVGASGAFVRHPTSGVAIGAGQDTTDLPTNLNAAILVRPAYNTTKTGGEAACLSCHKAHGNARGYALVYPDIQTGNYTNEEEGGAATVEGAYPIRNLCSVCHVAY
jgi:hypothetical protein